MRGHGSRQTQSLPEPVENDRDGWFEGGMEGEKKGKRDRWGGEWEREGRNRTRLEPVSVF